jgi:ribosomal protein S18 acetylase RimI-like enzyme
MPSAPRLRRATASDDDLLLQVYASTRSDELALVDWDAAQKAAFVRMQFEAQRRYYLAEFPQAEYSVIEQNGRPAGRLIVHRSKAGIFLMDIALLPEFRNAGIGTRLVQDLQAEAQRTGKQLRLYVEMFNRARSLYERLGFRITGESGAYFEMEWQPAVAVQDVQSA